MWNDKNTFGISKKSHPTIPPQAVARNQNMGIKMEKTNWQNKWMGSMAMGECKYWQRKFYIAQTNKHFEGRYGRLPLGNVYTCHGFLPRTASLKKLISKLFFTSLLKDLLTKDLVTLGNLLSTEFMEPNRRLYATLGKRA